MSSTALDGMWLNYDKHIGFPRWIRTNIDILDPDELTY